MTSANILDVAKYILKKKGTITTMKLQKLCYYSQAWSLAWDDVPLFDDDFEAWANGPVNVRLYNRHRGLFTISDIDTEHEDEVLTTEQISNIDTVLDAYWEYAPHELSSMTHAELPWLEARVGVAPGARSNNIISKESMLEYYSGLLQEDYE